MSNNNSSSSSSSLASYLKKFVVLAGLAGLSSVVINKILKNGRKEKINELNAEKRLQSEQLKSMSKSEKSAAKKARDELRLNKAYEECCKKRSVFFEKDFVGEEVTIRLREYKEILRCDKTFVIEGFASSGMCASLCAKHLVESLELPLVGEIICDSLPLLGVVEGYVITSGTRIYGDERMVVFVTDYKTPEDADTATLSATDAYNAAIVECIFDFCRRHHSELLLSVEGIPRKTELNQADYATQDELLKAMVEQMGEEATVEIVNALEEKKAENTRELLDEEETRKKKKKKKKNNKNGSDDDSDSEDDLHDGEVRFVCNNHKWTSRLRELNAKLLKDHVMTGVTGGIVSSMSLSDIAVCCLFSPYDEALPDFKAPLPIIELLDRLLGDEVFIDTNDLEKNIKKLSKEVKKAIESLVPKSKKETTYSMYT